MSHQSYIDINGHEFMIAIEYHYFKASHGKRCGGVQIEPNEPASVEIYSVEIDWSGEGEAPDLQPIELPERVLAEYEDEILGEYQ